MVAETAEPVERKPDITHTQPPATEPAGEVLNIKIVSQDSCELLFRVKKTTPFDKIFNSYFQRKGVDSKAVKFLFDGHRIRGDQTPGALEMEDNDSIDAMIEQLGGSVL
eukprot:jgi/Chlat1/7074/Chrsp57S09119